MKILALEFSSMQRSVAVLAGQAAGSEVTSEVIESGGRGVSTFAMMTEALRQAALEREQIECVAIGLGPGSYSGIRVAIAVAQGWQLAGGIHLLGLSSVEALAAEAQLAGMSGRIRIVIDAQRNELYVADWEIAPDRIAEAAPLRLTSLEQAKHNRPSLVAGPEASRWFADGRMLFPRAATLGKLALQRRDFVPGERLEPIYLREPGFVKAPPPRRLPL